MKTRLVKRLKSLIGRGWQRLDDPIPALPLDLFRIGAGALSAVYFWHLRREVPTISSPNGLLDHQLVRKMFPYTRLSFYQLGMDERVFRSVNLAAVGAAVGVMAGRGIRPNVTFLYLTAVSTYRWNLPAMYVDDVVMHLVLFWLQLLPTGKTLTLGRASNWRSATVPGFTTRLFTANLALIYFAAGLWKWNSPLWKQGIALYATLKMPISRAPHFWPSSLQPLLRPFSYLALILEPILAALPLLPAHSRFKYALGGSLVAFHAGIVATLRIPYANIACMAGLPLLFQAELMAWLAGDHAPDRPNPASTPEWQKVLASTCLTLLLLQNIWRIRERKPIGSTDSPFVTRWRGHLGLYSGLRHHNNPWTAPLYALGLVQSYRLLDWVDERNWHMFYDGVEQISAEIRPFNTNQLFPHTMRNVLLHSYIQNKCWIVPPAAELPAFQRSLLTRFVQQLAHKFPNTGLITIYINISRITRENLDLRETERRKILQFSVRDGVPTICFMRLLEGPTVEAPHR